MASQCGWWDICAVVPQGTRVDEDSADLFSPRQGRKRARDDRLSPGSSRQRRKVVHYEIDSLYDLISTWHYLDADIVQDARTHRVQLGNRMSNIQQEYVLDTRMRILKHFGNLFMRKKEYVCEELDKVSSMVRVDGGEVICRSEKRECSIAAYWSCRQRERESRSWEEDSSGAMKPGLGSRFFGTRDPFRGINTSRDTHDFSFACLPRLSPVFYLPSYICDTCHLLSVRKEGVDQLHGDDFHISWHNLLVLSLSTSGKLSILPDLHWAVLLRANLRKDMEFVNGVLQTATLGGGYWAVQDVEKAKSYAVKSLTLAKKMENQRQVGKGIAEYPSPSIRHRTADTYYLQIYISSH